MRDEPQLLDDARDLLAELQRVGAEFLVVGAHALAAHGIPRATGDFDILVRPTAANARRVLRALIAFGAPVATHGVGVEELTTPGTVYQLGLPPGRIDILTSISGVDFEDAWSGRLVVSVGGTQVAVLGRDALLRNKRASGRPKDLLDVKALENTSG